MWFMLRGVVYLHEFDSVRNSISEIEYAHRALFEEIVLNGNRVVLPFNQLTDSSAFVSLIQDDKAYNWIRELFEGGYLSVSLYRDVRTASQYSQNAINKCLDDEDGLAKNDVFYFSALPVKSTEKNLLKCMSDVLKFNDLTLLESRMEMGKDASIFYDTDKDNGHQVSISNEKRVAFLKRYLEMILFISQNEPALNSAKTTDTDNRFLEYLEKSRLILANQNKKSYSLAAKRLL